MIIGKKKKRYLMLIWNGLLCLKASAFAHNQLSEKRGNSNKDKYLNLAHFASLVVTEMTYCPCIPLPMDLIH
jgi:hypothetical protein